MNDSPPTRPANRLAQASARVEADKIPLDIPQYIVQSMYGGEHFFKADGTLTHLPQYAAVFNDWDTALRISNALPGSNRVMTRQSFRMPMPI